ncbi:hypothetical protein QBC34DRAFT_449589 [Podospora aff. communis PSN243]|uniref:DNA polymerase n=1 Tax=Podospora aff. communis PSN243 TaxID=3040156 RepID=A0AAV9GJQ0_9PEZI|nr:hypothetical protein QBC34DRAFT_449589 [Podospora aff. communis PSN243]
MGLKFPVIFLLPSNLEAEELHELEDQIPTLTYDINEAEIILGKIGRKQRALFELRKYKLTTEEVASSENDGDSPKRKRARTGAPSDAISDTASDDTGSDGEITGDPAVVKVVKLAWFTDSLKADRVLPLDEYIVYEGRKVPATPMKAPPTPSQRGEDILKRAMADAGSSPSSQRSSYGPGRRGGEPSHRPAKPPLLRQSTTEHDVEVLLPPIPEYLHTTYSCQRPTPIHPPNELFIEQLMKIRTARTLTGDKIGVRAYSSAIATLSAYPYTLSSGQEVARLPGCGAKIALLFQEFKETGSLKEAREDESDPKLAVLKLFYEIWGVAETTARDFYNKGWRDMDDIIEYGWDGLTRVQQIGVKYYDEFQLKIPRAEVEAISSIILQHANKIHKGFQMVIVGGYRRGKLESGDVDVVLSHPDEAATHNFVERIVVSLEKDKYITHTLTLSTKNSERGQLPVSWKGNEKKAGTGFDTLDKALVVWQDPRWTTGEAKNPNPHRRVDIIISPWKTAGCAVLGWTSGTTFQRDLRRYCKKERSLKFDSSGVRSRVDGSWVDLESGPDGKPAPDMLTAERRVFAGLELEYRPPEERCTG